MIMHNFLIPTSFDTLLSEGLLTHFQQYFRQFQHFDSLYLRKLTSYHFLKECIKEIHYFFILFFERGSETIQTQP